MVRASRNYKNHPAVTRRLSCVCPHSGSVCWSRYCFQFCAFLEKVRCAWVDSFWKLFFEQRKQIAHEKYYNVLGSLHGE